MHILIVEDDERIAKLVSTGFGQEGYTVDAATTGEEGLALLESRQYDAAVLDVMLPGISGLDILRSIRAKGDSTPVLVLSAKRALGDRIAGLDLGADDYLGKPFSFAELSARIHAITRRRKQQEGASETILSSGGVELDLVRRTCVREGKKIELQPREFALLELLLRNAGRPLAKNTIIEKLWGCNIDPQTNIVDVLVCKLRNKLDTEFERKRIQTIRGVGYVFRNEA